eukprot:TRINITY_DN34463_c0_g1_i1.p1 TRINITY_DN34463_c0_g1~~TRINITY_DN34463_c0_g1_i1.p1  ORF type:complete len:522 (+),score=139.71 TRINITY_DN34463_c0_g1_i1:92-1657(+)
MAGALRRGLGAAAAAALGLPLLLWLGGGPPAAPPPEPTPPPQWEVEGFAFANFTPLCVADGLGWAWPEPGPPPAVASRQESTRLLRAVPAAGRLQRPADAAEEMAFVGIAPAADSLHGASQLFHFMWELVGVVWSARKLCELLRAAEGAAARLVWYLPSCPGGGGCARDELVEALAPECAVLRRLRFSDPSRAADGDPRPGELRCHRRGVVGQANLQRFAQAVMAHGGKQRGYVFCRKGCYQAERRAGQMWCKPGAEKCSGLTNGRSLWPLLGELRAQLLRAEAARAPPLPQPPPGAPPALLVIQRRGTRRLLNPAELAAWAAGEGWESSVAEFEPLPLLQQFRLLLGPAAVASPHGSALAWAMLGGSALLWIELFPYNTTAKGPEQVEPLMHVAAPLADDRGAGAAYANGALPGGRPLGQGKWRWHRFAQESYAAIAEYAGANHIGWRGSCPGCTECPPLSPGRAFCDTRKRPCEPWWKRCDVRLPRAALRPMLAAAVRARASGSPCADPGQFRCALRLQ